MAMGFGPWERSKPFPRISNTTKATRCKYTFGRLWYRKRYRRAWGISQWRLRWFRRLLRCSELVIIKSPLWFWIPCSTQCRFLAATNLAQIPCDLLLSVETSRAVQSQGFTVGKVQDCGACGATTQMTLIRLHGPRLPIAGRERLMQEPRRGKNLHLRLARTLVLVLLPRKEKIGFAHVQWIAWQASKPEVHL